jgi:ribosomal protein L34
MWQPISTAPYDLDLELAVIDGLDGWINTETNRRINVRPTHWRPWGQATAGLRETVDRARVVNPDQRRALSLLAGSMHGYTHAIMLAHGFRAKMLADLGRDGFATTEPGMVRASGRQIEVRWMMITDSGRRVLAG